MSKSSFDLIIGDVSGDTVVATDSDPNSSEPAASRILQIQPSVRDGVLVLAAIKANDPYAHAVATVWILDETTGLWWPATAATDISWREAPARLSIAYPRAKVFVQVTTSGNIVGIGVKVL